MVLHVQSRSLRVNLGLSYPGSSSSPNQATIHPRNTLIDPATKSSTFKIRRIISAVILAVLVLVLFLMFHKPKPLAEPMAAASVAANAQSFQQKLAQLDPQADPDSSTSSSAPEEVRFTADEVQASLVQSNSAPTASPQSLQTPSGEQITLQSAPTVRLEQDIVKGQFEAEVAGQRVYVTVAGHLGAKDGYATFEPTEFRIGDMVFPVSMVNAQLQKKMAEQRDRMKLPDFISDVSVQNGELVIKRK